MITNPRIVQLQKILNDDLNDLSLTLYNSALMLYKGIPQNKYINLQYSTATVDYNFVPSYYKYVTYLSLSQIGDIIQNYVNKVNSFLALVKLYNLNNILQDKINSLAGSIATLNNYAENLYNNEQSSIINYIIPYKMSLRTAMLLNDIDLVNIDLIILFNLSKLQTVQLLPQNFNLTLIQA